jgi:hypothetical protein
MRGSATMRTRSYRSPRGPGLARLLGAACACSLFWFDGAAVAAPKPAAQLRAATAIEIATKPVTRFAKASDAQRFGRLVFRGGLVLTSPHPAFGGWSGLTLTPDGRRLVAVSDAGTWLTATLGYDGPKPVRLGEARVGPLRARNGKPLTKERERDAEAVTLLEGTLAKGVLLIGFEQLHRIGRFPIGVDGIGAPTGYIALPPEVPRLRRNKAIEAVTVLSGGPNAGSMVAFAEQNRANPTLHLGWVWRAGKPRAFHLTNPAGFEVTDTVGSANGDLLVLERRFRWLEGVKMRLRLVPAKQLRPGAEIAGETLLEADMSYEIDNMEGLAIHRDDRGETVLTLISDDNFNTLLQRTILLQFTLGPLDQQAAKRTRP